MNNEKIFTPILYINLEKRKDRKEHMEKQLKKYNFERVNAIENENGYVGCAESHIKCLKLAIERNYEEVIILEDDFMFLNGNNFNDMKIPEFDFDILLFCNRIKKCEKIDETFNKVIDCSWASGHLVRKNLYGPLIQNLQESKELIKKENCYKYHNDIYWNKLWKEYKCISYNYNFSTQKEGYSDIEKKNVKRLEQQNIESMFN